MYWSDFSLLNADIVCMRELLKLNSKWKYFLNQAGSVMPAMNIKEISGKLSALKNNKDSIFSMRVNSLMEPV